MTRLHLIRHGRPVVDSGTTASAWQLADDDEPFAALAASPGFPRSGWWVSSSEPKAVDTARRLRGLLGLPPDDVDRTPALGEMRRPAALADDAEFRRAVERSVSNPTDPALPGWESANEVLTRVHRDVAVRCEQARADGSSDVVLVGHGTAWSLLVAEILDRPVDLAAWRRMRMPDWCALDVGVVAGGLAGSLVADWGAWTPG